MRHPLPPPHLERPPPVDPPVPHTAVAINSIRGLRNGQTGRYRNNCTIVLPLQLIRRGDEVTGGMFINPLRGSSSPKPFVPELCSLCLSIQSQVIGYGRPLRDEDDPLWTTGLGVDLVNFDLLFVHITRGSCFSSRLQ